MSRQFELAPSLSSDMVKQHFERDIGQHHLLDVNAQFHHVSCLIVEKKSTLKLAYYWLLGQADKVDGPN
jgi:hypothetical protein